VSERWDGTWVIYPKAHIVADTSTATLGFLIKLGAQIEDVVAWRNGTLLRYAVTLGKIDHVKMLLEK
jgi:hypothetical protein